jgi:hypothetical protein
MGRKSRVKEIGGRGKTASRARELKSGVEDIRS